MHGTRLGREKWAEIRSHQRSTRRPVQNGIEHFREALMNRFRRQLNAHEQMNGTGLGSINSAENGSHEHVQKGIEHIREGFMNMFREYLITTEKHP